MIFTARTRAFSVRRSARDRSRRGGVLGRPHAPRGPGGGAPVVGAASARTPCMPRATRKAFVEQFRRLRRADLRGALPRPGFIVKKEGGHASQPGAGGVSPMALRSKTSASSRWAEPSPDPRGEHPARMGADVIKVERPEGDERAAGGLRSRAAYPPRSTP